MQTANSTNPKASLKAAVAARYPGLTSIRISLAAHGRLWIRATLQDAGRFCVCGYSEASALRHLAARLSAQPELRTAVEM